MAYVSARGRKPMERASKISHNEIIASAEVQSLLAECTIPTPAEERVLADLLVERVPVDERRIRHVVAIDGGYREAPVRSEFPSASVSFFTFGPLLFELSDLKQLDEQPFIAPEDLARLKKIQRYSFAMPTRNVSLHGMTLTMSIRETLQRFLESRPNDDPPLAESLRWLLFARWNRRAEPWSVPQCPNDGCDAADVPLPDDSKYRSSCAACGGPVLLVDALRLHERIDNEQGAGGILGYVMTSFEQVVLVHVIKTLLELKKSILSDFLIIKDGPLGFFGTTAPLSSRMQELIDYLILMEELPGGPHLHVVGLEKSGSFVEHAQQIERVMPPEAVLPLSTEYIYKYIVPGANADMAKPYAWNTYWGGKLIYKAGDTSTYVATVPLRQVTGSPDLSSYLNVAHILDVLASLRCSMYDNALIPVALANKLVSLSEFPSSRILERFAREGIGGSRA